MADKAVGNVQDLAESFRKIKSMGTSKKKSLADSIYDHAIKKSSDGMNLPKLKSGEDYYLDPESKKVTGVQRPLTAKETEEESGRAYFNYLYPFINKGLAHYSGAKSNINFAKDALKFGKDEEATQRLLDFLVANKLATAAVVKENATIGGNATRENYRNIRQSLPASDINSYIEKFAKGFVLPSSANINAGSKFSEMLNQAQKQASSAVPARRVFLFNPEKKNTPEYSDSDIQETSQKYGISPQQVVEMLQRRNNG